MKYYKHTLFYYSILFFFSSTSYASEDTLKKRVPNQSGQYIIEISQDKEQDPEQNLLFALHTIRLAFALRYNIHEGRMPYKEAYLLLVTITLIPLTHIFFKRIFCDQTN